MAHAEICPVCKGERDGKPCHGCGGKGWVTIEDNYQPWYPQPIYPAPWHPGFYTIPTHNPDVPYCGTTTITKDNYSKEGG